MTSSPQSSSPVTETLILAILEEELYLGRHHPTDYYPAIMGAKEAAKKIADLSCGAESNRHSGAVGTEKRAEQSNPGGGHEVTEHDAQKLYEQKADGMTPRPSASTRGLAQTPAEPEAAVWRWRHVNSERRAWNYQSTPVLSNSEYIEVQPLYASPPAQFSAGEPTAAPNRMDKGRAFYLAMYEKDGAVWAANDHKALWCDMAEDYERRALSLSSTERK